MSTSVTCDAEHAVTSCIACLQTLISSALTGIIVGLAFALPILIIATHNFIVGLMATINIVCITVTVIGFIPLMGWKLGVSNSVVVTVFSSHSCMQKVSW